MLLNRPQSVLCLSIKTSEDQFGIIYLEAKQEARPFSETDFLVFSGLSTQLAYALESAGKYESIKQKLEYTKRELKTQKAETIHLQDSLDAAQSKMVHLEKMASIGQMTAGIAHEINNPVNFVKSNIDSIKLDLEDLKSILRAYQQIQPETAEENLEKANALAKKLDLTFLLMEIDKLIEDIKEGASRTSEIISGLRNFSRLDEFDFKFVDINKGLDSTLILLNNRFKERIRIHKDYDDLTLTECLPGKIYQVFMNILTNSIQAIQGKGDIYIKTEQNRDKIFISIKDTGIGMSEEVKKNIFEPFFTTKDVGEGTGLGLSISQEIIERHQGEIRVNSTPSIGTEFIITLPVNQRHQDHG
ncbi:MAG: ATP-binding protein [Bacteroidia bacterium]|nr:ATP-binding protein [Bacteroidia bacterium]